MLQLNSPRNRALLKKIRVDDNENPRRESFNSGTTCQKRLHTQRKYQRRRREAFLVAQDFRRSMHRQVQLSDHDGRGLESDPGPRGPTTYLDLAPEVVL